LKKKPIVLIVDDLEDNRLAIKLSLKREPFEFLEAKNGQEALQLSILHNPDLILTDVMMPIMDGYELSKKIREQSKVPIIMVSALSDRKDKLKALECGVNDFISKPFDKTELLARVHSLLHFYTGFIEKQRELEELNDALEEKVKERTAELEREQEKKIFDTKLASIGKLSAGITHEINTPLAYIKGNMELLEMDMESIQDSTLKNNLKRTTDIIVDGINRIAMIIEAMREISQKNDKRKESTNIYHTLIVSLRMIFNRSKHICNIYINDNLFSMETEKNVEEFITMCNAQRIEQVWIILLNNALDALSISESDFSRRYIKINLEKDSENIKITFKDNGGGINEEIIDKIFEPFVSTKTHSGMGIGLNVANNIISEHNGTIIVKNSQDGAVFVINLPLLGK